jgi:AbrB family transcriptional regulator (stage V sporulation protein T)
MKATGIVRRIDDLGRIVIPKEIRRTMHIREGDPLEIYTDRDGGVIFKKYSQLGDISDFAAQLCEVLSRTAGHIAVITDRDSCVAVGGVPRRELADKRISPRLEALMERRQSFLADGEVVPVCEELDKYQVAAAVPILSQGDVLGCVLFAAADGGLRLGELELKLAQTVAGFLAKQMEG